MSTSTSTSTSNIATLFRYDTEFSADSVEWCPHKPLQNVFVCANYFLVENEEISDTPSNKRVGRILLFSISPENGLVLQQEIKTSAVLDQKWCHITVNGAALLGVVNSEKTLEIYELNASTSTDTSTKKLKLLTSHKIEDNEGDTLLLSLDWSTGKYSFEEPKIVASDSRGNAHLFRLIGNRLILERSWHSHDFEAWIAGFYYWNPDIFFTGGDDLVLCKYDIREDKPILKNRSHEAGVTCLHSNSKREHILITGSYDENIRLWDIRNFKTPVSALKMPGTLWRLKWNPFASNYILAACMLGGVHIINTGNEDNLEITHSYYEHKDLSYGADWSFMEAEDVASYEHEGNIIIGTCSFYDHLLCISKLSCSL